MIEPRLIVQHALERGTWRGPAARAAASLWERLADPVRPLVLPDARVIGVGGATLGGAGKTPVVAALARAVGGQCAVVASGYRARVARARPVTPADAAAEVGDEALLLARQLAPHGVPVVVGRDRADAVRLAAELAPLVVVDGLLQTKPERLSVSILVVDAAEPWGSDACPPCGDRRAGRAALLAAADVVVSVARTGEPRAESLTRDALGLPSFLAASEVGGVTTPDGRELALGEVAERRVGAVLAVARPDRILDGLAASGIAPHPVRLASDHAVPTPARRPARVDAWLTTAKCATKLGPDFEGSPLWTLVHRVLLPPGLVAVASGQKKVLESAPCFPRHS